MRIPVYFSEMGEGLFFSLSLAHITSHSERMDRLAQFEYEYLLRVQGEGTPDFSSIRPSLGRVVNPFFIFLKIHKPLFINFLSERGVTPKSSFTDPQGEVYPSLGRIWSSLSDEQRRPYTEHYNALDYSYRMASLSPQ